MPFKSDDYVPSLVNFKGLLTSEEVKVLAGTPNLETLQFDSPVHRDNWPLLEEHLFSLRPDVCLRAYAHYFQRCNVAFLQKMPSLQNLRIECNHGVSGLQALETLPNLQHLSIIVSDLDNFDFLSTLSTGLKSLVLGPTQSTKPDFSVVTRFNQLEKLSIGGHLKGLQVLPSLPNLGELWFSGLKSPNLDFLPKIPKLWSIEFLLGGSDDLSAIAGVSELKHLEIAWVRRLPDIGFISECTNLQRLTLDRLRQVEYLPNFEHLAHLRQLTVTNLNGLKSLEPIRAAPALEVFGGNAGVFVPEDYRGALQAPSLRKAKVYFNSQKKNQEFAEIAAEYGIST